MDLQNGSQKKLLVKSEWFHKKSQERYLDVLTLYLTLVLRFITDAVTSKRSKSGTSMDHCKRKKTRFLDMLLTRYKST